jgi:hypothetical protein
MSDNPNPGDIRGPGISVTGGSKVGNISRTGPGVTTPTPPPVRTSGPGSGITVTNGSRTGNIAYGNGAVASSHGDPSGSAPPATRPGRPGQGSAWDDAPGGRTAPTRGGSGGGTEHAEFGDLAAVRRFAQQIDSLGDGSDFVQVIKACHGLADAIRDFGGDMNLRTRAFVDAAIAVATSGDALRDEAAIVARLSKDLDGGE